MTRWFNRRTFLSAAPAAFVGARGGQAPAAGWRPDEDGDETFDHEPFGALLRRYVQVAPDGVNRVDYGRWKRSAADVTALEAYVSRLQLRGPQRLTRAEQFAFWVNLYNAKTLRLVLADYPVRSILAVRPRFFSIGPWKAPTLSVCGVALSLDQVENEILRRRFGDARVHYALNCASLGCPNLRAVPWRGASLDADLDAAATAFIGHPRGVEPLPRGVRLSSIYKWYRADFGGDDAAVIAHIRKYASAPLRSHLARVPAIAGYQYDWALNDISSST